MGLEGIDAPEVAEARADAVVMLLSEEVTIQRLTKTSDSGGGHAETWQNIETVPCTFTTVAGGEPIGLSARGTQGTAGLRVDSRSTHIFTLPAETDVRSTDRLVLGTAIHEVTLVRTAGDLEIVRRVETKETFDHV